MKQAPSVEMLKGQDRDRRGSGGKKLLFSSAAHAGGEQKAVLGKRAGAEQGVISPQEGKRGRALTLGLTSVSGLS